MLLFVNHQKTVNIFHLNQQVLLLSSKFNILQPKTNNNNVSMSVFYSSRQWVLEKTHNCVAWSDLKVHDLTFMLR